MKYTFVYGRDLLSGIPQVMVENDRRVVAVLSGSIEESWIQLRARAIAKVRLLRGPIPEKEEVEIE